MIGIAESPADFEACAAIFADVEPEDRVTAAELAASDGVLLMSGTDGYALVKRSSVANSAYVMLRVRPAARRRGVGAVLLEAALEQTRQLGRERLWGRVHELDTESLRVATQHGFREIGRDVDVLLDVRPGDGAWGPGIVELEPGHLLGAYEVAAAPPFEEWVEQEGARHAVAVVALDGPRVVGYARLYRLDAHAQRLENGLTAVRRSHRRRGIALALKRAQIAWAAEHGYTEIVSSTVDGNAAMRAVNERLGYRELPASIVVERSA